MSKFLPIFLFLCTNYGILVLFHFLMYNVYYIFDIGHISILFLFKASDSHRNAHVRNIFLYVIYAKNHTIFFLVGFHCQLYFWYEQEGKTVSYKKQPIWP